ncbi:hypothetical protein [Infirmifilum sp. NZ]|uniref:hypothetical protein n=1 Tax=Infirmifilum sp. NZ TaxID=2926850 RepID=UPI00279D1F93|nr:hypothetical protein [Infirmifilum sp. NZ]UNQ73146.1 hypothetical protein MOV14_08545 [Infirmifilum sp. NZ]
MSALRTEPPAERAGRPFVVVLARDRRHVEEKAAELERLGLPFTIVCGERLNHQRVVYREPRGKWDTINFARRLVPKDAGVVVLNDVDTRIHNFWHALSHLHSADLVYCRVEVTPGEVLQDRGSNQGVQNLSARANL